MESIWKKTAKAPHFPQLGQDQKTDVLIVGGGLTGLLCAWFLEKAGVRYLLVEAEEICSGISGNTTAKLTAQHGLIYDKLCRSLGQERAKLYLHAQQAALEQYRILAEEIPCDFEEKAAVVYSLHDRKSLEKEAHALQKLGAAAQFQEKADIPLRVAGAVRLEKQAQFHPLKFAYGIAGKLNIFEHTRVTELAPGQACTTQGKVTAGHIIVATHFPMLNKHGSYFLKLYQHRSYVLALRHGQKLDAMYVDADKRGLSFRSYQDLLLLGGGGHRTGKRGGGWSELLAFARTHYPLSDVCCRWAAQDCMSLDQLPYIGQYSSGTARLYTATGFNKWGMTTAMTAAQLLTAQICGKSSPYSTLFCPSRSIVHPQLLCNMAESVIGLLTPKAPRCPHLGCALHYNRQEHSWDCGCHGSRFSSSGKLLDNPATKDKPSLARYRKH